MAIEATEDTDVAAVGTVMTHAVDVGWMKNMMRLMCGLGLLLKWVDIFCEFWHFGSRYDGVQGAVLGSHGIGLFNATRRVSFVAAPAAPDFVGGG